MVHSKSYGVVNSCGTKRVEEDLVLANLVGKPCVCGVCCAAISATVCTVTDCKVHLLSYNAKSDAFTEACSSSHQLSCGI